MIGKGIRSDFIGEFAVRDAGQRLGMACGGECVLFFARHFPLLGDFLGGDAHAVGDADVFVLENTRIEDRVITHHRHHAHAFGTAADHQVGFAEADAIRRHRNRLQPGGTEAVDRHRRHDVRQTGQQHGDARDVHALLGLGHRAADHGVVDARFIHLWNFGQCRIDRESEHVVGPRVAENAARRLADRGADGRDDVGVLNLFAHGILRDRRSVAQRFAGGHRVLDTRLRLRVQRKLDEMGALQIEQPLFVDGRAALDLSAA